MKLTKLEHSAMILEIAGSRLMIDPGAFTTPLTETGDIVAVVITHEHADHWTPDQLNRILDQSPDARILAPAGVARAAEGFGVETVNGGDTVVTGPFTLRFFGEKHAVIHRSIPVIDNVGVLVNDTLYYPGDSFTVPEGVRVGTLAVPAGAPWLKISESIDFVAEVAPRHAVPVHEMVLSTIGKNLANDRLRDAVAAAGGELIALQPNESLDL